MRLVVDASVAIKWPIDEPDSELADRLLDGAHDFLAPELIIPEVLSAAWKRRRLGEIAEAQFDAIVARKTDDLIACRPLRPLASRAAAIARELDHPVYVCFYLAWPRPRRRRWSPPTDACSTWSKERRWPDECRSSAASRSDRRDVAEGQEHRG